MGALLCDSQPLVAHLKHASSDRQTHRLLCADNYSVLNWIVDEHALHCDNNLQEVDSHA